MALLFVIVYGGTNWLTAQRSGADVRAWCFAWERTAVPFERFDVDIGAGEESAAALRHQHRIAAAYQQPARDERQTEHTAQPPYGGRQTWV